MKKAYILYIRDEYLNSNTYRHIHTHAYKQNDALINYEEELNYVISWKMHITADEIFIFSFVNLIIL